MAATPSNRLQKLWYQYSALALSHLAGPLTLAYLFSVCQEFSNHSGFAHISLLDTRLWKEIDSTEASQAMSLVQSILQATAGLHALSTLVCFVTSAYWWATLLLVYKRRQSGQGVPSALALKPRFSFFIFFMSQSIFQMMINARVNSLATNEISADFLRIVFSLGIEPGYHPARTLFEVASLVLLAVFYFALASIIGKVGRRMGFS